MKKNTRQLRQYHRLIRLGYSEEEADFRVMSFFQRSMWTAVQILFILFMASTFTAALYFLKAL